MLAEYLKQVFHQGNVYSLLFHLKKNFATNLLFYLLGLASSGLYRHSYKKFRYLLSLTLRQLLKFKHRGKEQGEEEDECKLVLCVRTDLAMGKGKIAAQCGHASIGAYTDSLRNNDPYVNRWFNEGQRKVVLKINDYEEMKELKKAARSQGLNTHVTRDAGRTQIPSGSYTVIAIGPGPDRILNKITGHLKLL